MIGLPGREVHLEFTQFKDGSPCPAPTRDNLLVLYVEVDELRRLQARMARQGYQPVPPENPYWLANSLTYEDPDGWSVVLCHTPSI